MLSPGASWVRSATPVASDLLTPLFNRCVYPVERLPRYDQSPSGAGKTILHICICVLCQESAEV